jgi:homoserine acetyltransferase
MYSHWSSRLSIPAILFGVLLLAAPLSAADYPKPTEGDHVLRDFRFASGQTLPELRIHYRTLGKPERDARGIVRNAVLILHGTTGQGGNFIRDEFAGELFGKGQLLDASRYYIVLPDGIGHGKSSKPSDKLHAHFPAYGYHDMIEAQYRLLTEGLKVDHLRLVMGTSMGGMHTWLWGEKHPDFMDALLPLASLPVEIAGRNRMWRKTVSDVIRTDPDWKDGEYTAQPHGLRIALELLALQSSSPVERQKEAPTRDKADAVLKDYVDRSMRTSDANDVLYAVESSRDYDPAPALGKIKAPLLAINFADDLINPPELGILEREIKKVKRGQAIVMPASAKTRGHGTHTLAAVWKDHLAELLKETDIPTETPEETARRHERVAERRKGTDIICHRGSSEHAFENTLEAFRATFELGGDGNEFDIRLTRDGVLVVFHDDMLDRRLEAYGDVSDYTWEELRRFRFRDSGRFGEQCRIPTLIEVFDLHRKYGGLMHLDIKRQGLDEAIAELLTRMDMWDQVGYCNTETGGVILRDPRYKARRYKASGLYLDRSEVFPDAIDAALKKPGDGVILDDPRGVAVALGRKLGKLSTDPVSPKRVLPHAEEAKRPVEAELIATLRKADDWDRVAETEADQAASGQRIRARARAAEQLLAAGASSKEAFAALEERVRKRSLHKDWMYHGFDGAMALRTLILLRAPNAVEMARFVLWRDDPALEPVIDPRWKNPRSWTDFRVKMVVWPALEKCPGAATEKLCRDYLALSDEDARKLGPPQYEEAAKALLAVSPRTETALELMKHRLQVVRGRIVLDCLAHAAEPWARAALEKGAPHALAYRVDH